jgi:hypothetical protein
MDPWTPVDRDSFINDAITSTEIRGNRGYYNFKVYPKLVGSDAEDPKRAAMTDALARVIFQKDVRYRAISLHFYRMLIDKIRSSTFVSRHFMSNFYIILKGSTGYRFLLGENFSDDFAFSDLDIVIYINPYIEPDVFQSLRQSLGTILLQVMSQYKRILDHMLFLNKPTQEAFLDEETLTAFKNDLKKEFDAIDGFDGKFVTPFEDDEVRNACSKHSFMMRNSEGRTDSVVRVEVPHFPKCERIPLRRTPLLASHNATIAFNREGNTDLNNGVFDLYRLKFTGMFAGFNIETEEMFEAKISADFIDVTIADQMDSELIDFWNHGTCVNVYVMDFWMVVPDVYSCMQDLYKMLYVYECPDSKRAKRERRYKILHDICANLRLV